MSLPRLLCSRAFSAPAPSLLPRLLCSRAFSAPAPSRLPRLLGFRAFSALALTLLSFAVLAPAHAGSYTGPVYSGGASTEPPSSGHPSIPYATGSSLVNGTNYGGYGGGSGDIGSSSCSGKITVTFTLQPAAGQTLLTDPPPPVVILQETCMAEATGNSIPAATIGGSCDNGLGMIQAPLTQTLIPYGFPPVIFAMYGTGFVNSTRYLVLTATPAVPPTTPAVPPTTPAVPPTTPAVTLATITFDRNPTAKATCIQGASASLRYSAAVYPVMVNMLGTTPVYGNQVLTGQQLTSVLNVPGGFSVVQPTGQTGYQWTIVGNLVNKVFKNYDATLPSNQLTLLAAADLKAVSPSFYDSAAETVNATCTVILLAPDGVTQIPVTVKSKDISVLKPTVTAWGITGGIVRV
jgi:hypothetical protein